MDVFNAASDGVKGSDGSGVACWRHFKNGNVTYSEPEPTGLAARPNPNAFYDGSFKDPVKMAWQQYTHPKTKAIYWHNTFAKETTLNDPAIKEKQQPPPPPPPPENEKTPEKKPNKKPEKKPEKREQDQWFKIERPKKGKV